MLTAFLRKIEMRDLTAVILTIGPNACSPYSAFLAALKSNTGSSPPRHTVRARVVPRTNTSPCFCVAHLIPHSFDTPHATQASEALSTKGTGSISSYWLAQEDMPANYQSCDGNSMWLGRPSWVFVHILSAGKYLLILAVFVINGSQGCERVGGF